MRLIDTDKLELKETVRIQLCGLKEYVALYSYTKEQIEEAPTVKAITVEWIKNYLIPFKVHHDSLSEASKENDGAGWVIEALETMMREWEKENGENSE